MQELFPEESNGNKPSSKPFSIRELLAILFRRRRIVVYSFFGLLGGALLAILLVSPTYESQMEVFLDHQRIDPAISTNSNVVEENNGLTQDEVASEVELFMSRDSLQQAVVDCGLYAPQRPSVLQRIATHIKSSLGIHPDKPKQIYAATLRLEKNLQVIPVNNSNVLKVSYDSQSPQMAAQVLNELGNLYLAKHAAVHHSPGAADFFGQEAQRYKTNLENTEAQLVSLARQSGDVSPDYEKTALLQKLVDFSMSLEQTNADIADGRRRIAYLKTQESALPTRITTQVRVSDNPQLMADLESSLLTLETKRTQLLETYAPQYPLVQEVDKQIAQARSAIEGAEKAGSHEQVTDENPTAEWIRTELVKDNADLIGSEARATAMTAGLRDIQQRTFQLAEDSQEQQDLVRLAKADEESYFLYHQKSEEAHIDNALDASRIVNAAIAERPVVPMIPIGLPLAVKLLLAVIIAAVLAVGCGFLSEYMDQSFQTPSEVEEYLDLPLLAAVPRNGH
jgi:polysaccharide biosynthesis protein PslE